MYPPVFLIIAGDDACTTLLGTNPTRFWPFGQAPEDEQRPYATHQLIVGVPLNHISCKPGMDQFTLQIDCFAKTASGCRTLAKTIGSALEDQHAVITSWDIDEIDQPTGLYRVAFTVDFFTARN